MQNHKSGFVFCETSFAVIKMNGINSAATHML